MSLNKWGDWFWQPYSRIGARWYGWRDARLEPPMPRWDSREPAPYLRQLKEASDLSLGNLLLGLVRKDSPLDSKLQQLVANERALGVDLERAEAVHDDAVRRFQSENPGVPASTAEHRRLAYRLIVAFLIACEIPLNAQVFQVLREGQLFNYLIAAGIGTLMLLAAHYAGIHLRRKPFESRLSTVMFGVALTLPLMAVLAIASLRAYYLHVRQLVDSAGEGRAYWAFLSFNLVMFAIAFYMSWFCHLEGAEEVTRTRRIAKGLKKKLASVRKALRVMRAARLNLHRKYVAWARQILHTHWQYIHVYNDANLRKRNDRKGRDNDVLLAENARQALMVRLPRALEAYYLDYRDLESAGVRSVGSDLVAADHEEARGGGTDETPDAQPAVATQK